MEREGERDTDREREKIKRLRYRVRALRVSRVLSLRSTRQNCRSVGEATDSEPRARFPKLHSPAPHDVFFVVRGMAYTTDRSTPLSVVLPLIVLLSQDAHVVMAHRFSPKVSLD